MSKDPGGKVAAPAHVRYLHKRITDESNAQSVATKRMVRWVGHMVVAAMLDNVRHPNDGRPVFLVKGGVAMELHLNLGAGRPPIWTLRSGLMPQRSRRTSTTGCEQASRASRRHVRQPNWFATRGCIAFRSS